MHDEDSKPIPGVSDEEVLAAVQTLPEIPITTAGDPDRFVQEIRHLVEERAQAGWPNEGKENVAAFVMVPYPRQIKEHYDIERVLDLRAVLRPVLGSLFFLSIDGTNGCAMQMPVSESEILDWLEDHNFGEHPVVLIYRATSRMTSRVSGCTGTTRYDPIRESPPVATIEQLLAALDHFHRDKLLTPLICSRGVWEKGHSNAYIPGAQPETTIQKDMQIALSSWFRGELRVEMEDTISIGRIDVRLLQKSPDNGALSYWTIIELKVVRSFHNAGQGKSAKTVSASKNIKNVVEGLKQIDAYKRDRIVVEGLLEVFDMRRDKTNDVKKNPKVQSQLGKCTEGIVFNVRPMFGSAKDARDAGHP